MSVEIEHLRPDEVDTAVAARSLVYLPLGSIEYHSHHLPIGLDGLTAHGVCVRAAERTGGIVLPTLWWGTGGTHTSYPWTIMTPDAGAPTTIIEVTLQRLQALGVAGCVLFTGHFADEQLAMIDTVAAGWNDAEPGPRVLALGVNRSDASLDPDHAGTFETTLLHALHPDLVAMDRLPGLDDVPLDPIGADGSFDHRHTTGHPLWGVMGPDPRPAELTRSGELLAEVVDWTCRQIDLQLPREPR